MTVRVSKPEFNLREKITELDKPTGLKGNELMRSETTQDARDFIAAGRKNLFINGALNIAQRGDSIASGFVYSMDQWFLMNHGSTTTRETSSPPEGFTYYARFASANTVIFQQCLELPKTGDAGYLQGKTVTVSFYARTETNATAYVFANFRNAAGGGDHTTIFSGTNEISVLTSSWKRYSRTFTISATPHANNKCMAVMVRNPSGQTSGTWEITGLQMEFGSTATEFDHRPVEEELALCQRYCVVYGGDDEVHLGTGHAYNATNINVSLHLPVPMRSKPSASRVTSGGNWVQAYVGANGVMSDASITIGDSGGTCKDLHSLRLYLSNAHSGRTAGEAFWVHTIANAKLILSAEL